MPLRGMAILTRVFEAAHCMLAAASSTSTAGEILLEEFLKPLETTQAAAARRFA